MNLERAVFVPDLDRLPPPGEPYERLYLGSEFCVWRLPAARELHEALAAAAARGLGFSLVTPFLDEPGLTRTLELIQQVPPDAATEVVANDLGLIESLRAAGWRGTIVAGRLLTRQRRGPGFQSFGDIPPEAAVALRGSVLDSPAFVELLGTEYSVKRFELDDLVQGVSVPALPAGVSLSLYRPYMLVTATRNCPWVFDGRTWDRSNGCGRPCRKQAIRLVPVQAAGSCRCGPPSCSLRSAAGDLPSAPPLRLDNGPASDENGVGVARSGGPPGERSSERAPTGVRSDRTPTIATVPGPSRGGELLLGGCAQFLEHRSAAPPPAGVDRIVWQPDIPA